MRLPSSPWDQPPHFQISAHVENLAQFSHPDSESESSVMTGKNTDAWGHLKKFCIQQSGGLGLKMVFFPQSCMILFLPFFFFFLFLFFFFYFFFVLFWFFNLLFFVCLFVLSFAFSRATPAAYGGSQARSLIGAVAAGLHHIHSNTGSEPCL